MAEFSAVGSFAISNSSIFSLSALSEQDGFTDLFVQMDVQLAAIGWMHPQPGSVLGHRDLLRSFDDHEIIGLDALQQFADMHVRVALCAREVPIIGDSPLFAPHLLALGDGG